jgi:hypothetical protein
VTSSKRLSGATVNHSIEASRERFARSPRFASGARDGKVATSRDGKVATSRDGKVATSLSVDGEMDDKLID